MIVFEYLKDCLPQKESTPVCSLLGVFLAFAYLVVLVILGMAALRKCPPEDVAEVLRALFGRK
jgi:hypothetical protein